MGVDCFPRRQRRRLLSAVDPAVAEALAAFRCGSSGVSDFPWQWRRRRWWRRRLAPPPIHSVTVVVVDVLDVFNTVVFWMFLMCLCILGYGLILMDSGRGEEGVARAGFFFFFAFPEPQRCRFLNRHLSILFKYAAY